MLENLLIWLVATAYMLVVVAFAIACVLVCRWAATKLEDMLG